MSIDFDIGEGVYHRTARKPRDRNSARAGPEKTPLLQSGTANRFSLSRLQRGCLLFVCCLGLLTLLGLIVFLVGQSNNEPVPDPMPPQQNVTTAMNGTTTTGTTTTGTTMGQSPAATAPPADPAQPIDVAFLCNVRFDNGTCRAIFTYENPASVPVTVPAGANNYVEPGPPDRGQLTLFRDGYHFGGATFLWNCDAHPHARWTVRSGVNGAASVATAPSTAVTCPPVPIDSSLEAERQLLHDRRRRRKK